MKSLRYILIALGLLSILSISAQVLAQQPEATMHSTSVMQGAGSTLPSAITNGTVVTGEAIGTYTPANAPSRPRRVIDDDDEEEKPEGWKDPMKDPLGDALLPLALIAAAYALFRAYKCKRGIS